MTDRPARHDPFVRYSVRHTRCGHVPAVFLILALALGVGLCSAVRASPGTGSFATGTAFLMEELSTGVKRPFDMWVVRMANACFDQRFTTRCWPIWTTTSATG